MSGKKQAVTSSLEQRAWLITVKYANDDPSNDFTGTEGVTENALTATVVEESHQQILNLHQTRHVAGYV